MPKDEVIRLRCSAADKERFKRVAEQVEETLSEFILYAAKMRAAQEEHGSVTRAALRVTHVPEPAPEPLDAQGVQLTGGVTLGKRTFRPDPKK